MCIVFIHIYLTTGNIKEVKNHKDILNTLETHPFCKMYNKPLKLFYDAHEISN